MAIMSYEDLREDLADDEEDDADNAIADEIAAVGESLTYATEQIATLLETQGFLQSRDVITTEALKLVRLVHESIARDQRLMDLAIKEEIIFESIDESAFRRILATEADDGKNIIQRLIDSVIKAFEWLWEKITEIFKSPPVEIDENLEDKIGKAIDAAGGIKEAIVLTGKEVPGAFFYLGESVTLSDIQKVLKNHKEHVEHLKEFFDKVLARIDPLDNVVSQLNNESVAAEFKASLESFSVSFAENFKTYMKLPYTAEVAGEYGFKVSGEIDLNKSHAYGPVLTGSGPAILFYATYKGTKGTTLFNAALSKKKLTASEKFKIDMGQDGNAIKALAKDLVEYSKKLGEQWDAITSKQSQAKATLNKATAALNKVKSSVDAKKSPELAALVGDFTRLANAVGKLEASLFGAIQCLKESVEIFNKLVQNTVKVIKSNAKAEEKSKEGEAPKEGEKPAEPASTNTPKT
jgi:hypothetical protein